MLCTQILAGSNIYSARSHFVTGTDAGNGVFRMETGSVRARCVPGCLSSAETGGLIAFRRDGDSGLGLRHANFRNKTVRASWKYNGTGQ